MPLNRITRTALEGLGETCNQMVMDNAVSPQQVKDFLECICYIISDSEVREKAGPEAAAGLVAAKWAIERWVKKWQKKEG